jgi:hypothetical protein
VRTSRNKCFAAHNVMRIYELPEAFFGTSARTCRSPQSRSFAHKSVLLALLLEPDGTLVPGTRLHVLGYGDESFANLT